MGSNVSGSEMSNFFVEQGRTRVAGKAYCSTSQPENRGGRRSAEKGPFLDGPYLNSGHNSPIPSRSNTLPFFTTAIRVHPSFR